MKTLTLLAALLLLIGLAPDASAMGYPHRLFASRRLAAKSVMSKAVAARRVVNTNLPAAQRTLPWPGLGTIVRVLAR